MVERTALTREVIGSNPIAPIKANVVELADTQVSKTCAEMHGSSNLPLGTKKPAD